MLFAINVIFIVDTELTMSRNESRQAGENKLWTLGQTLALLLLVLHIRALIRYLLTTTSLVLPFMGETAWGRAVKGISKYDDKASISWCEVYRWTWIIGDTRGMCILQLATIHSCPLPVKADSGWLLHALMEGQWDIARFLSENGADWALSCCM
jgi:hypothetical protein